MVPTGVHRCAQTQREKQRPPLAALVDSGQAPHSGALCYSRPWRYLVGVGLTVWSARVKVLEAPPCALFDGTLVESPSRLLSLPLCLAAWACCESGRKNSVFF